MEQKGLREREGERGAGGDDQQRARRLRRQPSALQLARLQLVKQEQQMREQVGGESLVEQQKVQRLRRALYTEHVFARSSKQARFKVQRGLQRHLKDGEHGDSQTETFTGEWFEPSDGPRERIMTTVAERINQFAGEWSTNNWQQATAAERSYKGLEDDE